MIVIPLSDWFRLPRLGSEGFRRLMIAGVEYESRNGFRIREGSDLQAIKNLLESELRQDIEFSYPCFICSRITSCQGCIYHDICSIEKSGSCICEECSKKDLRDYIAAWRRSLASFGD
ncbi:MAG: hypothetical protein QXQ39_07215 [Conexivisphaerales archaeon]